MTEKRLMRMLSGAKLELVAGRPWLGKFAEEEIARRAKRRARKSQRFARAA